jgi:hypothetical protein
MAVGIAIVIPLEVLEYGSKTAAHYRSIAFIKLGSGMLTCPLVENDQSGGSWHDEAFWARKGYQLMLSFPVPNLSPISLLTLLCACSQLAT